MLYGLALQQIGQQLEGLKKGYVSSLLKLLTYIF